MICKASLNLFAQVLQELGGVKCDVSLLLLLLLFKLLLSMLTTVG